MKFWNSVRRGVLPVLFVCALLAGCAGTRKSPEPVSEPQRSTEERPTPGAEPVGALHVVQPGETLWRIARTYGVEIDDIAEANAIADPSVLVAGRQLFIPGAAQPLQVPHVASVKIPTGSRFLWPVPDGRVISYYGAPRRGHRHAGIDIGANHGKPVVASLAGRVTYAASTMRGYGKTVVIEHGNSLSSLYAHNSQLLVDEGEWVDVGQAIARIGRTGNASADHCHFEIRHDGVAVNPLPYLQDPEERN